MSNDNRVPPGTPQGGQFAPSMGGMPASDLPLENEDTSWIATYNARAGDSPLAPPVPRTPEQHYRFFFENAQVPPAIVHAMAYANNEWWGNPPLSEPDIRELMLARYCAISAPDGDFIGQLAEYPVTLSSGTYTLEDAVDDIATPYLFKSVANNQIIADCWYEPNELLKQWKRGQAHIEEQKQAVAQATAEDMQRWAAEKRLRDHPPGKCRCTDCKKARRKQMWADYGDDELGRIEYLLWNPPKK